MKTRYWDCGCSMGWSMFGDREILKVEPCISHIIALASVNNLAALSEKLRIILETTSKVAHSGE